MLIVKDRFLPARATLALRLTCWSGVRVCKALDGGVFFIAFSHWD